jgi:hypothetical protein
MNKEVNRHLRALTFDNVTLDDYSTSLPFVQRILNSHHSDRLKISASESLFGNVLKLDRGIFLPPSERLAIESKPLSKHMIVFLNPPNPRTLSRWITSFTSSHTLERTIKSRQWRKFSLHSLRLDHTAKFSLSCLFHETFSI